MTDKIENAFAAIREFGWDSKKRETNRNIHGIDFADITGIFDDYTFVRRSDRHGEIRYQVFGYVGGRQIAVTCTVRGPICRLISARPARRDERQKFYDRLKTQSPKGQY